MLVCLCDVLTLLLLLPTNLGGDSAEVLGPVLAVVVGTSGLRMVCVHVWVVVAAAVMVCWWCLIACISRRLLSYVHI